MYDQIVGESLLVALAFNENYNIDDDYSIEDYNTMKSWVSAIESTMQAIRFNDNSASNTTIKNIIPIIYTFSML